MSFTSEYWGETPVFINMAIEPAATMILAHGAGAGSCSECLEKLASAFCALGINVIRFDFPYMVKMTTLGKRRPPDKAPVLIDAYRQVLAKACERFSGAILIAGKSMGGRMATLMAAETADTLPRVKSIICIGYPFHPPAKPEKTRIEHFGDIGLPVHIFQGERDRFGRPAEVLDYRLPQHINVHWLTDGDHDVKPRKSYGLTWEDNINQIAETVKGLL